MCVQSAVPSGIRGQCVNTVMTVAAGCRKKVMERKYCAERNSCPDSCALGSYRLLEEDELTSLETELPSPTRVLCSETGQTGVGVVKGPRDVSDVHICPGDSRDCRLSRAGRPPLRQQLLFTFHAGYRPEENRNAASAIT